MKNAIKRELIALNLKGIDTPGLVSLQRAIVKGFNGPPANPNFTAADLAKLPVSTADMLLQATALEGTHTLRQTNKSASLTAQEHDYAVVVINTITDTAAFVEAFANRKAAGDLALAIQIITSVGFQLKKEFTPHQRSFEVVSANNGRFHLRTKSAGIRTAYVWQWSDDDGKTWSLPIITIGSEVIITELKNGINYSFRYAVVPPVIQGKPVIPAGSEQLVWSNPINEVSKHTGIEKK